MNTAAPARFASSVVGFCAADYRTATRHPVSSGPRWLASFVSFVALVALLLLPTLGRAAEVMPPAPRDHFNDYAGIVRSDTAQQLERELTQFERDTSNQILVAIYPRMQSASSVEDYTVRVAQSWRAGQAGRKNGAVLFVFQESHDIRIQVGYGLESVLPDARCKQIIENEITPRFRAGDFTGGVAAGVHAMLAATRNEYRGTGAVAADQRVSGGGNSMTRLGLLVFVFIIVSILRGRFLRPSIYGSAGRRTVWLGGGGWGGGSSGGGGSFSGGGGSFGGGGAGGKW